MSRSIGDDAKYPSVRSFPSQVRPDPDRSTGRPTSTSPYASYASPSTAKDGYSPAVWGVGWRCPAMMIGLYLCGMGLSLGHHLYYDSLDDTLVQSVEQQTWAIRIGTGFAFLIKTLFVAAIGIAAVQQIWSTLRRKSVNLRGIDAMFSILNNPITYFIPDLWICAKTVTLLATVSWLVPLTALITPATLSVNMMTMPNIIHMRVSTVNFTQDFWSSWALFEGAGRIEQPSSAISRFFTATSSSVAIIPFAPSFPNSSYTLEFYGPSYRCQNLSEVIVEMKGITFTDGFENYSSIQDVWQKLVVNSSADLTFPPIYKGSAPTVLNNTLLIYGAGHNSLTGNSTDTTSLVCQLWNTSYVLGVQFTDSTQTLVPISTEFVAPSNWDSSAGADSLLEPQGPDVNGGYYITHLLFSSLVEGKLSIGSTGSLIGDLPLLMRSGLFDCPELWNGTYNTIVNVPDSDSSYCRNRTLAGALEDLSRNFTYSLLSLNSANTTVPVTIYSPQNFYSYDRTNLLVAYVVALSVTVVCLTIGFYALWDNGVPQDMSFSTVLRTTRNPALDSLATGYCLGSDQLADELSKVKLRFGEVETTQPFKHAGFGFKESVTELVRGEKYY